MKDNVGGGIQLGAGAVIGIGLILNGAGVIGSRDVDAIGIPLMVGSHLFSIYRSFTYHKPHPQSSANAANFKPYDGLKLTILPTESGDYKVYARYDYTF